MIMSPDFIGHFRALPSRPRHCAAGELLFRSDDPVGRVHLVERGLVHLVRLTQQGAPVIMQRAGPGMLLAEASIFAERYHCDAVAEDPTDLLTFARADVLHALDGEPGFARALARHLAGEVVRMRARAELLSLRTVAEKVDAWLALGDGAIPPRGRQRFMADEIGVTPEALYRELARRRDG